MLRTKCPEEADTNLVYNESRCKRPRISWLCQSYHKSRKRFIVQVRVCHRLGGIILAHVSTCHYLHSPYTFLDIHGFDYSFLLTRSVRRRHERTNFYQDRTKSVSLHSVDLLCHHRVPTNEGQRIELPASNLQLGRYPVCNFQQYNPYKVLIRIPIPPDDLCNCNHFHVVQNVLLDENTPNNSLLCQFVIKNI